MISNYFLHVYLCVVYVYVYKWAHMYEGQRLTLNVFLTVSPPIQIRQHRLFESKQPACSQDPISDSHMLELQKCYHAYLALHGSSPHVCMASALPTDPFSKLCSFCVRLTYFISCMQMFFFHTRMCIMCMPGTLKRPEKSTGFPRTRVTAVSHYIGSKSGFSTKATLALNLSPAHQVLEFCLFVLFLADMSILRTHQVPLAVLEFATWDYKQSYHTQSQPYFCFKNHFTNF